MYGSHLNMPLSLNMSAEIQKHCVKYEQHHQQGITRNGSSWVLVGLYALLRRSVALVRNWKNKRNQPYQKAGAFYDKTFGYVYMYSFK